MELIPVGPQAVLVALDPAGDAGTPAGLAAWARGRVEAHDVVPGADTVLFDGIGDLDALSRALTGWQPGDEPEAPEPVEIRVRYDGEDLESVAEALGMSPEDVVRRHQQADWTSRFCGFAPGFAYLAGWDLRVSRLATPRTKVPPGSVALADGWCGIYPVASPGGWRLIGHTDAELWDPDRTSPALLAPGTRVRFVGQA